VIRDVDLLSAIAHEHCTGARQPPLELSTQYRRHIVKMYRNAHKTEIPRPAQTRPKPFASFRQCGPVTRAFMVEVRGSEPFFRAREDPPDPLTWENSQKPPLNR
jgi:hypothetical protein